VNGLYLLSTHLSYLLVSTCCRVMSNCPDLPHLLGKLCGQKLLDLGLITNWVCKLTVYFL